MGNQDLEYASFDRRMIAATIDVAIITLLLAPIMNALTYLIYGGDVNPLADFFVAHQNKVDAGELWGYIVEQNILIKFFMIQFTTFFLIALFIVGFWFYKDATPGKLVTKCRIIDVHTGARPSFMRYICRFLCYILSILPLCLGFFLAKFTKKRQTLHDIIAGTAVILVQKNTRRASSATR